MPRAVFAAGRVRMDFRAPLGFRELDHGVAVVVLVEMLMLDPMDMRAVCPHLVDEIVVGRRVGNGNLDLARRRDADAGQM